MKEILTVSALLESGAGLLLLAAPSTAIAVVFDAPGDGAGAAIVALVISSSLGSPGPILWAIAALHAAMAIWCVSIQSKRS